MANPTYIDANEFIETLKAKGLVIVSANEFEASKSLERKRIMRKKSVSLKEIIDYRLLPLTSKKGVESWINRDKIKANEVYREVNGKIMVLTSAIKRLGYEY